MTCSIFQMVRRRGGTRSGQVAFFVSAVLGWRHISDVIPIGSQSRLSWLCDRDLGRRRPFRASDHIITLYLHQIARFRSHPLVFIVTYSGSSFAELDMMLARSHSVCILKCCVALSTCLRLRVSTTLNCFWLLGIKSGVNPSSLE